MTVRNLVRHNHMSLGVYAVTNDEDVLLVAMAMHGALCGDWEAAGFEVKLSFMLAAEAALKRLAEDGWDLFAYPEGGWK